MEIQVSKETGSYISIFGRHCELHIAVGDVGLAVVEAALAEELLADGRKSSITAHNQISLKLFLGAIWSAAQIGNTSPLTKHLAKAHCRLCEGIYLFFYWCLCS